MINISTKMRLKIKAAPTFDYEYKKCMFVGSITEFIDPPIISGERD
jgi:hypothetical protein